MKILEKVKEWTRAMGSGPACDFCGRYETGKLGNVLFQFGDVLICRDCLRQPMGMLGLDMLYWDDHPEEVPPCRHCGKIVSSCQLNPLHNWYFCDECTRDFDVTLQWNRVHRRMMERRLAAHRLELKRFRQGAGTP